MYRTLVIAAIGIIGTLPASAKPQAAILAFPGAEGGGMYTPGGPDRKLPVENLTIQWCISSEALDKNNHAFGGTWGGANSSFHHNLFACNTGRNPSIGMTGPFDFRNNVLFNWRHRTIDGGDGASQINVVNNYFKPGPATKSQELRHRLVKVDRRFHDPNNGG